MHNSWKLRYIEILILKVLSTVTSISIDLIPELESITRTFDVPFVDTVFARSKG
jgi:hypothetical protein